MLHLFNKIRTCEDINLQIIESNLIKLDFIR